MQFAAAKIDMKMLFRRAATVILCCVVGVFSSSESLAQAPLYSPVLPTTGTRPAAYPLLRFEEDWSFLKDPKQRKDWLDPIKYIPFGKKDGTSYLTIGGEVRGIYEHVLNDNWNARPYALNQFALERFLLHFDTHINPRVRLFVQLESGLQQGRPGGSRPIDEKKLDFLNAFADLDVGPESHPINLRIGRQELQFGSGRFIAVREGPNVRHGFYGFRVSQRFGQWSTDGFAVRPTNDNPGFFDDTPNSSVAFWGLHTAHRLGEPDAENGIRKSFDLYYYGIDRKSATFNQGTARELRHTFGGRVASRESTAKTSRAVIPHFDVEAAGQLGTFGSGSIRAWTASTEFGMILNKLPGKPRIGTRADIASGDGNPANKDLQTFNALYPIGNYFGILADTGPGPVNLRDIHPNIRLFLPHGVSMNADWLIWWRQSLNDGVYNVAGNLIVSSGNSQARFVGHRPGIEARWQIDRHAYVQADYGLFYAGPFLKESGRGNNLNYASVWAGYKF